MPAADRERSAFELMMAIDEADRHPVAINALLAVGMLHQLGSSDRAQSIYALCRNKGVEFVDAVATLRVLRDAGIVEIKTEPRMDERVSLTVAGRRVAEGFAGVPPRAAKAEALGEPTPELPADGASSMASMRGINSVCALGATVPRERYAEFIENLLVMNEQSMYTLTRRTGVAMIETAETLRVLRDAGVVVIANTSSDPRVRLSGEGRALAKALRAMATPPANGLS